MSNRGGARDGAGRPKGEETVMVRVPKGCLEQVRALISVYKNTGALPVVGDPQPDGDLHAQVDLPLPSAELVSDVPPDLKLSKAQEAWAVYLPALSAYKAYPELKDRFFKLIDLDGRFYSYLFLLQLLERLVNLPRKEDDFPLEWCNIRVLRSFARDLYNANPHTH
ncbi:hypothetical protein ACET73_05250 [Aeromonas veronii]